MSNLYDRNNIFFPDDSEYLEMLGAIQYAVNYCTYNAFLLLKKVSNDDKIEFFHYNADTMLDAFVKLNKDGKYADVVTTLGEIIFRRNAIYYSQTVSATDKNIEIHSSNRQILWYYDSVTGDEIYITRAFLIDFLDYISRSIRKFNSLISDKTPKMLN
ncbi:MAG: hypothetical protein LBV22_02130 [Mycoplasmataceae bacterium]|jgi:hypothetical protein|nr:hypothetical protein [Mycoplasmataceae bacterium]